MHSDTEMPKPRRLGALADALGPVVVPAVAWAVYGLLVIPSVLAIPMSIAGGNQLVFPPRQVSLDLYHRFFGSVVWMEALRQSVIVALGTASLATAIGVGAAYGLARSAFFGRRLIGFFLFSPLLVPAVVVALGLYLYFARFGLTGTTAGLIFAHTVLALPFVLVTTTTGIRQIDVNVELAATMMGASKLTILTRVVLPQIWPSVLASALLAFVISFDEVVLAWFIAGVGTATLPVVMFSSLRSEVSPVIAAAAAAAVLITMSTVLCLIFAVMTKRDGNE